MNISILIQVKLIIAMTYIYWIYDVHISTEFTAMTYIYWIHVPSTEFYYLLILVANYLINYVIWNLITKQNYL